MKLAIITQARLDAEAPPAGTTWITCAVCGLRSAIPRAERGRLCGPCRADMAQTEMHVECVLATAEARWEFAYEAFEAQAEQPDVAERWARVRDAQIDAAPEVFALAWSRRRAEGGAFGALLIAKEQLDALSDEVARLRAWAAAARAEIDGA